MGEEHILSDPFFKALLRMQVLPLEPVELAIHGPVRLMDDQRY